MANVAAGEIHLLHVTKVTINQSYTYYDYFFLACLQLVELASHTQLVNRHLADLYAATAHITHAQTGIARWWFYGFLFVDTD